MNITQDFAEYGYKRSEIENYHPTIYQLSISALIDDRFVKLAKKEHITDIVFKEMHYEYHRRMKNQCMITIDWKDNYTKILVRAFNGVKYKYLGDKYGR